ncbi:MAG: hypothetical protein CMJ78_03865 [Planctomycetaceae bacterium]|nr:hypothetical protein [Planctomycetaceae bacterium]
MATKLATLRSQLSGLRRRRASIRIGTALSVLTIVIVWSMLLAFVFDWSLMMSVSQRFVSLLVCVGVSVLVFRRLCWPYLSQSESLTDLALIVERQQQIDSDLVAALQFEGDQGAWGSKQLEDAVVDNVANIGGSLNVLEGVSYEMLVRRAILLTATILIVLGGVIVFPQHATSFLNRFFLGGAHYPTKTHIESIVINGETVFTDGEAVTDTIKIPFGQPLKFQVECLGIVPQTSKVILSSRTEGGAVTSEVGLEPIIEISQDAKAASYAGELGRLVDSVSYQVYAGDAWTDPLQIELVPLPNVSVDLNVEVPDYAASIEAERLSKLSSSKQTSTRQISVIEGSRVGLTVNCRNKSLIRAALVIDQSEFALTAEDEKKQIWKLQGDASPLAKVTEPIRYEVQVEDSDGLKLEVPIKGSIRLKSDRRPRVVAAMISRLVIPTAKPRIIYGATDDYGLSKLSVHFQIVRQDGVTEDVTRDLHVVGEEKQPTRALRGNYPLDLEPLKLVKGDEVKITLEAFDYRGTVEPKSNVSEALIVEITDREGILAGLLEADERSAEQLDEIIRRELGIRDK